MKSGGRGGDFDVVHERAVIDILYLNDALRSVRTYVWIVPNWTSQQSTAKSTERQGQQIAYQSKL